MGNSNSKSDIQETIIRLSQTEKFNLYRTKFLTLGKDLYFDEDELTIESINDGPYTIDIFEFDWLEPNIESKIYNELDNLYSEYLETEIRNFIEQSLSEENIDWNDWLNKYCHSNSFVNKNFKGSKSFKIGAETIGYPPSYIWYLMLHKAKNDYSLIINANKAVMVGNEIKIAELENINNQWFYTNIPDECMHQIRKAFEQQFL